MRKAAHFVKELLLEVSLLLVAAATVFC